MDKIKNILCKTLIMLIYLLPVILCCVYVFLYVWCLINYGDKPVIEIPSWAYFFLNNN